VGLGAAGPLPLAAGFERVILDVPCSGLGTLRRDPDLKWIRTPEDLSRLAAAESRMLAMTADVVRPGGRLVYATCSSEPDENLDVVRRFLAHDRRFRLEPLPAVPAALRSPEGCLTTTPPAHGLDSFFAALLVRREDA
jgi:16S rRNA (cytosine967-C5)-methyltransferase